MTSVATNGPGVIPREAAAAIARGAEIGQPLADVLPEKLGAEPLATLPPLDDILAPEAYLGEAEPIIESATQRWQYVVRAKGLVS
jgi:hypothetical protein